MKHAGNHVAEPFPSKPGLAAAGERIRIGVGNMGCCEAILATAHIPHADPYSFTRGGQPWFAWEWFSDVVTGVLHSAFGLAGVALLYASLVALSVWLWFRLHWAVGGNFLLAAVMAPLLLT